MDIIYLLLGIITVAFFFYLLVAILKPSFFP